MPQRQTADCQTDRETVSQTERQSVRRSDKIISFNELQLLKEHQQKTYITCIIEIHLPAQRDRQTRIKRTLCIHLSAETDTQTPRQTLVAHSQTQQAKDFGKHETKAEPEVSF